MRFIILGKPIAWARPRLRINKFWDSQKKNKLDYSLILESQRTTKEVLMGPLSLTIEFHMPIPSSIPKTKQQGMDGMIHTSRPDLDNMIKFVADACNQILYNDDAQIAFIQAKKVYSLEPKTIIELKPLTLGVSSEKNNLSL